MSEGQCVTYFIKLKKIKKGEKNPKLYYIGFGFFFNQTTVNIHRPFFLKLFKIALTSSFLYVILKQTKYFPSTFSKLCDR